ncbi:TIR domain-containing protein [Rhizobium sp. RHZ01]|uniref:TIR domain-containing protein n=1 Tax=Rhizobium sp. RHZ01 TaxID=2769304 RepID=UPI001786BEFF|nr:TIR domain-containing protein [Rhizobium sp. RHZ01]MBD9449669.1 TIR domain-containing protein [Rhizobium sp. RHZ01]
MALYNQQAPTRRKVFISYHHGNDQACYNEFSRVFHDQFELLTDNSLEREIDSGNFEYIMRRIREYHLHGSSCTLVLCGAATPRRRYVDWEIHASLAQNMGLVGIGLPTIQWTGPNSTWKPARLQDNIDTGYAGWTLWDQIIANPSLLISEIEASVQLRGVGISNHRPRMTRNE